jgi:uncharacterized protein involved in exopolysaccharide biosynthesis
MPTATPRTFDRSFTIRDMRRALARHKFKAGCFFVMTVAASVALAFLSPLSYSSTVKVYVRPGRESLNLDPTATTGERLQMEASEQTAVNSALEILGSRIVAEKVVQRLGADAILRGSVSDEANLAEHLSRTIERLRDTFPGAMPATPSDETEEAVIEIGNMVDSHAERLSNVVTIDCRAGAPEQARDIVSAVADVFLDEYVRVNRNERSLKFFTDQSELFEAELAEAVEALRREKDRFGLVSLDGHRVMLEGQLGRTKSRLLEIDGLSAATDSEVKSLSETLAGMPEKIVTQAITGFGHEATDGMRQQLYELEIKELDFLSKYTESSPFVTAIRRQRAAVEKILNAQPDQRTQTTEAINPVQQALRQQKLQLQAKSTSLNGEKDALRTQETQLGERLKEFNEHEMNLTRLQREVQILEAQYRAHAESLEQARIDQALAEGRVSSINILQPATLEITPVNPSKRMIVMLGIVLGALGSLAIANVAELLDTTVKSEDDVEHHLALPVLLSLPRKSAFGRVTSLGA